MTTRHAIRFLLNDGIVERDDIAATQTLLDFLRLERALTGTKEGCNEGDCGACTVLVGRLVGDTLHYQSLNACIRFTGSLDGCHVVSVEHLARGGKLHPVQQAMMEYHGSQCGFCTPGIVMSLYALWMKNAKPSEVEIETALQGNLCRCTGYEPIIKAAQAINSYGTPAHDRLTTERAQITAQLKAWQDGTMVDVTSRNEAGEQRFFVPQTSAQLTDLLAAHENATIIAGATDVGLWVNKDHRAISPAVFIGNLQSLQQVDVNQDAVTIGAGVSYSTFVPIMRAHFPHMNELWWRIGGEQVRNMGTLGGNIANGSPIGDTPPAFITMAATLTLRSKSGTRHMLLEEFFITYGKQDRRPGEFVESITLPIPEPGAINAVYKISKRRDEDISAVCGAFSLAVTQGKVSAARIAFGGMAGTPKRASHVETALVGQPWTLETIHAAQAAFDADYQPLSDWRASAAYRQLTAKNLLMRVFLENTDQAEPIRLKRVTRDEGKAGHPGVAA